ncbi:MULTISPECIES: glycoside hydrolase family 99-like domain-containing protein [unclassified Undibacterium]|uniref:glycoside hydrolase family 99-like domain-containing protein n=1 Tax=unclassified Undibacterium TaxID=2630295 RepID=UPI003C2E9311
MENHNKYSRDVIPDTEESLSKIVAQIHANSVVLDIGCSSGMLGHYLVLQKECVVDGVDIDQGALEVCSPVYRKVTIRNLETDSITGDFVPESYDYIIVADVIEHLNNPDKLLAQLRLLVKPHGAIIFSVPNITHIAASLELLAGQFSYTQNGLLDNTHLRFYSYQNLIKKLADSGIYLWALDTVQRNLTETEFADVQTRLFPKQWLDAMIESRPDALVYQWIVTTKIYPSMHAVPDISRLKKKLTSPIFTTALYWQSSQTSGFNETNKLPGFRHDSVLNEFVVEFHFPALEDECISKIRIDPASEMKSIWIKNAYIADAQGSVLWQWSGAGSDADLINAFWSGITPAEGRILMAENNDPQWYPDVPSDVLARLNKGYKFAFTLCDDSAAIDALLEMIWGQRLELSAEELRQMSVKVSQTEDLVCKLEKNNAQKAQEINELTESNALKAQEITGLIESNAQKTLEISELNQSNVQRAQEISELKHILNEKEAYLQSIIDSKSWKITKPLRYIRRKMSTSIITRMRLFTFGSFRVFWRILPLPLTLKNKLKAALIKNFPSPFHQYSKWITAGQHNTQQGDSASALSIYEPVSTEVETVHYVARLNATPLENKPVRLICFYLPQFHAIPQNDAWWGEGFTEWSNVRPAQPQFHNHYQPHVPGELGYYDLLDTQVQRRQIELAKLYGIEGFCFYFYWFGGTRLLEKPIENYLNDRSLDLPFCLCWANENWSRRWDGLDHEVLIAQQHSPEDDLAFIEHVARYMRDPRYIRISGKPLLLVYRPGLLPSPKETVARWRDWCRQNGIGEIYLTYTQSFEALDPATYDFDAAVEFPPNNSAPPDVTNTVTPLSADFSGRVYDARIFAERSENYQQPPYTLFRGVCPSWDNTARRKNKGTIFLHSSPLVYQRWLANAIRDTVQHRSNQDERLIFVNAWNEWAEGAHLEPDERYGYAYLQATRNAITRSTSYPGKSVLLVTHDCHPHGAQFLILETAKQLKECGFDVTIMALDGGNLWDDFNRVGKTFNIKNRHSEEVYAFLEKLNAVGTVDAITNTVICGSVLPLLKHTGFKVLSLIHEMPGVIRDMKQEENARTIAQLADKVVFPAALVHELFNEIAPVNPNKIVIRPQGVLRKNPFKGRRVEAHKEICELHHLPLNSQIVLAIGYLDMRKGADLFVEVAADVIRCNPNVVFIWVGHAEAIFEQKVKLRVRELKLTDKVIFAGFVRDPMAYYAAASVYALTSREDPFPNVVLESAEVNVPVVAFKGASGTENLILECGGRLANYLESGDFAEQVCALLNTPVTTQNKPVLSLRQYSLDLMHHLNACPRVSVVVPNYNYAHYLAQRLETVCTQSFPIYELIILDDNSSDDSEEVVQSYMRECPVDCTFVVNPENSGSVFLQWKKGVDLARGDLIWIAEADDLADKKFLEALIPAFFDPSVVLAFTQSKQIDEHGNLVAENYLDYTKDISDDWSRSYCRDGAEEIAKAMSIKNTIPNVSGVLFKHQTLKKVFDEMGDNLTQYKIAGDWLIYIRVLLEGKIYFNQHPLNLHRRHTNSATNTLKANLHLQEVIALQEVAKSVVTPGQDILNKANLYIEYLHHHFGLPLNKEKNS